MVSARSRRMKILGAAMVTSLPKCFCQTGFASVPSAYARRLHELFRETTNVGNHGRDLIGFHALAVSRHLVLTFLDNAR